MNRVEIIEAALLHKEFMLRVEPLYRELAINETWPEDERCWSQHLREELSINLLEIRKKYNFELDAAFNYALDNLETEMRIPYEDLNQLN